MIVCEISAEHGMPPRPEPSDRPDWLGGEAMVPVRPARSRTNLLSTLLSPQALVLVFLVGAIIGSSVTTLFLPTRKRN